MVAVYMFAQTVGIKPRQKSSSQRICFCPQCSVALAMGLAPEGALNLAAWDMIRDLVSSEPSLNQAAWENLRGIVGFLTTDQGQCDVPVADAGIQVNANEDASVQPSDAWVDFRRVS